MANLISPELACKVHWLGCSPAKVQAEYLQKLGNGLSLLEWLGLLVAKYSRSSIYLSDSFVAYGFQGFL
jgi:hypothetical protein